METIQAGQIRPRIWIGAVAFLAGLAYGDDWMAEIKPFAPAKLIVGVIYSLDAAVTGTEEALQASYGPVDFKSAAFRFDQTDYYDQQMGRGLSRLFLSFSRLVPPESLSSIKVCTNSLEKEIRKSLAREERVVNIDPGILTASALIMATAKDFAHRIPLSNGIYAHLELLFSRKAARLLPWSYPDFRQEGYQRYFLEVRQAYLRQLKSLTLG
jgi:Domain of unknown function (DUF4416)